MQRWIMILTAIALIATATAQAEYNALGLYFSDEEFSRDTASAEVTPDFGLLAYIVLTNPTGSVAAGYEVGIVCTAADFNIPITSLGWGQNSGTNDNQIVHFHSPLPLAASGTVFSNLVITTASTEYEEISFGPSDPSSLPDGVPVVDLAGDGLQPCSYPFGTPVVAWLNDGIVAVEARTLSELKRLFD